MDERLEEIKEKDVTWLMNSKLKKDWEWLIQQAEQVQALKEDNKRLKREIRGYSSQLFDLTSRSYVIANESKHLINKMLEGGERNGWTIGTAKD